MATTATFLHVTDIHLVDGKSSDQSVIKTSISKIADTTRIEALRVTAELLAERLKEEKKLLDGILFTGDAQDKYEPHGHMELRAVLEDTLKDVMKSHWRIVATPGNHDVPRGSEPGSKERYAEFMEAWRKDPVDERTVTPWLDDIDGETASKEAQKRHSFVAPDNSWSIFPINSCNWSHTQIDLPSSVDIAFKQLLEKCSSLDAGKVCEIEEIIETQIKDPIKKQLLYDIAHVSESQLAALKSIIRAGSHSTRTPLRIVVLHHHLIAPSLRAEFRPFQDIAALSNLRTYLRQNEIDIVIHGHKHVDAIAYDSVYDHSASQSDPRRLLVLSGGTFDGPSDNSAMSLIGITGLPGAPNVTVQRVPLGRRGFDLAAAPVHSVRLWRTNEQTPGGPVVIHGSDIDDVYARAVQAASEEANMAMLIAHLDLPLPEYDENGKVKGLPFPKDYPHPEGGNGGKPAEGSATWFEELAEWWQLSRSNLESRIPYIHGTRLRRFANQFDQIGRIVSLLKSSGGTSRAVAILVDPLRDFRPGGDKEDFASFCLVQFRRRSGDIGGNHLDCTAYYRAQEFKHWWPVNVAELRLLQIEVAREVGCSPGRITTIAADARAIVTRSPGQAAIPIVDRWLDQSPKKLFALACQLSGDGREWGDSAVMEEWRSYLNAQLRFTDSMSFHPDGSPVAVNGLEMLASYVEAHSAGVGDGADTAAKLRKLARENRNYESSSKDRRAFDNWADGVRSVCKDLLQSAQISPVLDAPAAVEDNG